MKTYEDTYEAVYNKNEEDGFLEEIRERRKAQELVTFPAQELKVMDVEEVQDRLDHDVYKDTQKGAQIAVATEGSVYAVRGIALDSLNGICGIRGSFLDRVPKGAYPDLINGYGLGTMSKKPVSLFIQDCKVTGFLGGKTFREIPAWTVFRETSEFIKREFPKAVFHAGAYTHEISWCSYDLSAHAADFRAVLAGVRYSPELTVITSDCGRSSVTFRPYIRSGNVSIPVNPLRIEHRGKTTGDSIADEEAIVNDIWECLNQCYSLIDKGVSDLARLDEIEINHPHTTLLRVMKACKINQAAALTVAEEHKDNWGPTASALDLYMCICETQIHMDEKTAEQRFRAADDIARAAAVNWKKYDLPGDFSW